MRIGPVMSRGEGRPLAVSSAGIVGALLIHALLILPFVLDLSAPAPRRPIITGAGASALASPTEPYMTVVFIDEPSPVQNAPPPAASMLASRGMAPPDLPLVVLSSDPSPAAASVSPASDDTHDSDVAEAVEHARLYGRYVGQVQARIERAWLRPRSTIGAPRFSCRARIQQDRSGDVIDVRLDHCNGTERWQQSLVSGIRTASPLPAPPDVSVYADMLWLTFNSEAFQEGGSPQGFEPEARMAGAAAPSLVESLQEFVNGGDVDPRLRVRNDAKVIHLTIIGTPSRDAFAPRESPPEPLPPPIAELPSLEPPPQ